ncbi:MAG: methylenetetrahydrofolate reductase [Spirochaetes bacterium]|nr:methylenetetrahydrofolate reductase [Spirochaetota bacterium]
MKSGSNLEKVLSAGHFAVTTEIGSPRGSDISAIKKKAEYVRGRTDAVNVTDCQTAMVRMSSISVATILIQMGIEPVMQMTCRDRNRIAMQSDIFGASALGIRNMLSISGDHQSFGDQKNSKKVFDIDSIQLVGMVKRLRDERKMLGDDKPIEGEIPMFIGAAANPFVPPVEFRALHLKKKIDAGADFIQTQAIYDIKGFRKWMRIVCDMGLDKRCRIMGGLIPLKTVKMAQFLQTKVPGITISDRLINRLKGVPGDKVEDEGMTILCESIEELRSIEGVSGVHIMAIGLEHRVPEITERANLYPRPVLN